MRYDVEVQGRRRQVQVTRTDGRFVVEVDGRRWSVDAARVDGQTLSLLMMMTSDAVDGGSMLSGGRSQEITVATNPGVATLTMRVDGVAVEVNPNTRARQGRGAHGGASGPQRMTAPMAGKVVRVLVKSGETVAARQPVVVIEAMKMENELRAVRAGRVTDVAVRDGQSVEAGALLAVIADH